MIVDNTYILKQYYFDHQPEIKYFCDEELAITSFSTYVSVIISSIDTVLRVEHKPFFNS